MSKINTQTLAEQKVSFTFSLLDVYERLEPEEKAELAKLTQVQQEGVLHDVLDYFYDFLCDTEAEFEFGEVLENVLMEAGLTEADDLD